MQYVSTILGTEMAGNKRLRRVHSTRAHVICFAGGVPGRHNLGFLIGLAGTSGMV